MYEEKLEKLMKNSYSPYFKLKVAAVVVMNDGKEFNGVNVENACGASVCAERVAIFSAIAAGYKKGDFEKIYVMTEKKDGFPCGVCRQVMVEFDIENIFVYENDRFNEYKLDELLPHAFSGDDL